MTGKLVVEVDNISKRYRYRGSEKIALSSLSFFAFSRTDIGFVGAQWGGEEYSVEDFDDVVEAGPRKCCHRWVRCLETGPPSAPKDWLCSSGWNIDG